jgi:nitronate monooxygenase
VSGGGPLTDLSRLPLLVAPMGGGPSTPALVIAAAQAGALGFLAAAYKTVEAMEAEIDAVQAAGVPFGINVFVPGTPTPDPEAAARYVASLGPDAGPATWDDDGWDGKVEALLRRPPPLVSFTFGCPPAEVVAAFRAAGTLVAVTVTHPDEAAEAVKVEPDCLCAQGFEAGAHRGIFANTDRPDGEIGLLDLLARIRRVTDLPFIAAGGIADADAVAAARSAGADAVQVGTAFLRCPESGANPTYKAALADPRYTTTAVTRAFSGRPARGLLNRFMEDHSDAPAAYPEINNATRPLRAKAAAAGDPERMSLWAGTAFRKATDRPAAEVIEQLAAGL